MKLDDAPRLVGRRSVSRSTRVNRSVRCSVVPVPTALVMAGRKLAVLYEYACHEGNRGLENILAGARRLERD